MSLFELLEKIIGTEEREVELELPEERVNLLAVKILQEEAKRRGKVLKLKPAGPRGKRLLACSGDDPLSCAEGGESLASTRKKRFKLPHLNLVATKRVGLIILLVFGILFLLGGGAYWAINFLPRAEVTLTLQPVPLVKELSVSADPEATGVDAVTGILPGQELEIEAEGQKTTPATGTATVGEKATGTIRFVNGNPEPVRISEGDEITDENLIFIAESGADVPAFGQANVEVEAAQIGAAYNLKAGVAFTVEGEDIQGTNDAAFAGGESHQVTIVSWADQMKVLEDLTAELIAEGKETLQNQIGSGWLVIQEAISDEEVERKFLQNVGAQADAAGLSLKLKLTTIAYKEDDLEDYVTAALVDLVPDGYELYPGETSISVLNPELSEGVLRFSAKVSAQVIPQLDLDGIKAALAGRNTARAQEYLASLSGVTAYELRLWPSLPESLRRVPKSVGRIRIELKTDGE